MAGGEAENAERRERESDLEKNGMEEPLEEAAQNTRECITRGKMLNECTLTQPHAKANDQATMRPNQMHSDPYLPTCTTATILGSVFNRPGQNEFDRLPSKELIEICTLKTKTMKATEITQRYHDAWNGRDADALVAAFTKDGIFCSPDTYPGISGEALAEFVKKVWTAFPDFRIELLNAGEIEPGIIAHHWIINCTNTGQGMDGSAPTGRAFAFKGASIIQLEGDKILSDRCYFDRLALAEQPESK